MGAGAAAFTPARKAVITEGPSDALLLPALLRAAANLPPDHSLGFQVAGGLAWTPPRLIRTLDSEASHVVYLTDSDKAGGLYRADLERADVDPERIFSLRAGRAGGASIEDFVAKSTYARVVTMLLRELRGYDGDALTAANIPNVGAAHAAGVWTKARGLDPLPKPAVAEHLLRVCRASLAYSHWDPGDSQPETLLRASRQKALRALLSAIRAALDIDDT